MSGRSTTLGLQALSELALASSFGSARSPFDHPSCLLIALDDGPSGDPADWPRLARWLVTQTCPVIGIGSGPSEIADACDAVVADASAVGALVANIERAPIAAMTLVQVLRATAQMSAAHALAIESLAYSVLQAGPEFRRWSAEHPPAPGTIPSDDGPAVKIERRGASLLLQLNRPSSRNAMTVEMRDALVEAFELAATDDDIGFIAMSGAGACFSTGGALEEFGTAGDPASSHVIRSIRLPAAALLRCRAATHFHVHGACIGSGIELPAFARRLTASPGAFFQLPEIRFGLIPGAGGCISIPRRVGRQRTAWLALSARRINAATALEWGLIDAIETPAG